MGSCNCKCRAEQEPQVQTVIIRYTTNQHKQATKIQKTFRGYIARKKYSTMSKPVRSENPKHSNSTNDLPIKQQQESTIMQKLTVIEEDRLRGDSCVRKQTDRTTKVRSGSFSPGLEDSRLKSPLPQIKLSATHKYSITPVMQHDRATVQLLSKESRVKLGAIKLKEGNFYKGEWFQGKPDGVGRYVFGDQSSYQGAFREGLLHGYGEFITKDNHIFKGDWFRNTRKGFGTYFYPDGSKYEGSWENDYPHGKGEELYFDGSKYIGQYVKGKRQGFGRLEFSDGSVYEGGFEQDFMSGVGIYRWPDKRIYTGGWRRGKMHGRGKLEFPDGRIYEGDYLDDLRDGFGIFAYPDGRRYEGQWKDGLQHGDELKEKKEKILKKIQFFLI
ncbi:hypothetical protein pb186bvf_013492 [Paramecium bursaria]